MASQQALSWVADPPWCAYCHLKHTLQGLKLHGVGSQVYIPQKDYPGYNFIGLIIGPRGNTQKRMQKETNTKIAIRGKGSVKEGAARDPKYDYGEEEELHVLITGDKMEDVSRRTGSTSACL